MSQVKERVPFEGTVAASLEAVQLVFVIPGNAFCLTTIGFLGGFPSPCTSVWIHPFHV